MIAFPTAMGCHWGLRKPTTVGLLCDLSSLRSPAMNFDASEDDSGTFSQIISSLKTQIADAQLVVDKLRKKTTTASSADGDDSSAGMSFLELKNHLMLNYLQNLVLIMLKKASGISIADDPAVVRIVETRAALEKMRPMEVKLKYHIDKLMKAAVDSRADESDPSRYKPNPDQLMSAFGEAEEAAEETDDEEIEEEAAPETSSKSRTSVYVPPRLAAVPYNVDENPRDRVQKEAERAKKRALHSTIMQELRQDYYDEPEEIHDRDIYRTKADKSAKEREEYEERNMVRLNVSKKDKARTKRMTTMGSLAHLADFQDFRPMTRNQDMDDMEFGSKNKKRKQPYKRKGKKTKKAKHFKK
ncbi:neuroguidin-like [Paramacrobiotus metropolitanus]|uniref:neuroguidin-like n=1 Tax=Paramacrobiotus metropolitanus TaxID=2943436 RepID=UPI002445B2A4|nr:neuroguidin-like [Paramacrobiotus metropolitanus]